MFRIVFTTAFCLFVLCNSKAQDIQWASSVTSYSSQKSDKLFAAYQASGQPNTFPQLLFSPCAWMPDAEMQFNTEYLITEFDPPISPQQIIVLQNMFSNTIEKITTYTTTGDATIIYQAPVDVQITAGGSVFQHGIFTSSRLVNKVRIDFKKFSIQTPYQIDAIGLSVSSTPIQLEIKNAVKIFPTFPEHLSNNINSDYDEVTPVIAPDGKTLYFDRKHHPQNTGGEKNDDIWYSELDYKFEWQPAKNIGPPLNNANHNFLCSISSDGNKILLGNNYGAAVEGQPGISTASKQQDGWSRPEDLYIDNFINLNEFNEFCMSADGQVLMMAIENVSGHGQKDIYVSFKRKENIWSEPINIGNRINTAGNEMSPFIAADNITLYFSTNGWPGYGGQDIFICKRLDNTWLNWSEPVNMGPVLNTDGWDAYYTVDANGTFAYFTSNKDTKGDLDIYRIRLPDSLKPEPVLLFTGDIFDKATNERITATLTYFAVDAIGGNGSSTANQFSPYGVYLLRGSKYLISVSADGYFDQMAELDLTQATDLYTLKNNFYLIPKKKGTVIELNNIEFNANSSVLNEVSFTELYKVIEFLQENPGITIEIRGHTNGLCEENYCNALSERRAQAVAQYLIEKGITERRVTYKGYGKQFPIADNETVEGRQKNQRVEFMITDIH